MLLGLLRRYAVLVTSGSLLFLSLALLVTNTRSVRRIDPLGGLFLEVLSPVTALIATVQTSLRGAWSSYVGLVGVRQENEWLRQRVRELETHLARGTDASGQNARLQALLDLRETMPGQAVAARIIAADSGSFFRTATINKGERDGVTKGMAVITPLGAVGRVVTTSSTAARVLLLEDRSSAVDAIVERSRARGIVAGAGDRGCLLKFVKRREDLQAGDRIVSSGLDGIFPKGIAIGTIVRLVNKEQGLFQTAEVEPAVDFGKVEEVLVVPVATDDAPPVPPPGAKGRLAAAAATPAAGPEKVGPGDKVATPEAATVSGRPAVAAKPTDRELGPAAEKSPVPAKPPAAPKPAGALRSSTEHGQRGAGGR